MILVPLPMMELQLGLALFPSNSGNTNCSSVTTTSRKGLDLNSYYVHEPKELGSGQTNPPVTRLDLHDDPLLSCVVVDKENSSKKRSFDDAFDESTQSSPQTLPLLLWDQQPNEEDDPKDEDNSSTTSAYCRVDGDQGLVGWPPIKCRKNKKLYRQNSNNRTVDNGCAQCQSRPPNSNYVKVKMEGLVIARKIDITKYHCFQALKQTLLGMFGLSQEDIDDYRLTYQDREGDWLLAEDMPSRNVMASVQRLRLMRSGS
ncbi:hypothetical protein Tsubulata_038638 [Turnera subulata]|uniref:Auxin-responsive protein n=1 Tax=Turnera subulata TaxID=218843 RepID=A0A9Q0J2X4_9ROSI|nr:hypothetical protein Tsubulata_038638 [Turnera subulata]